MRSPYLIFVAAFCLVFAAACSDDSSGGAAGSGGTAGTGGTGGGGGGEGGAGGGEGGAGGAPPSGDLGGEFRAFSSLLVVEAACAMPLLTGVAGQAINPDATGADISSNCIIAEPPDVGGSMTITDMGGGNYAISAVQDLKFAISADIDVGGLMLTATIASESSTTLTGTGTGSAADGGSITLDALAGDLSAFNMIAEGTGNVNCSAMTSGGQDASALVCGMIPGLDAGDNPIPLPGDPGAKLLPVLNFDETVQGELLMEMGDGPDDASGWYISNPAPMPGNGTQFVTLTGAVTVN